jgi:hypothetical protein
MRKRVLAVPNPRRSIKALKARKEQALKALDQARKEDASQGAVSEKTLGRLIKW